MDGTVELGGDTLNITVPFRVAGSSRGRSSRRRR